MKRLTAHSLINIRGKSKVSTSVILSQSCIPFSFAKDIHKESEGHLDPLLPFFCYKFFDLRERLPEGHLFLISIPRGNKSP